MTGIGIGTVTAEDHHRRTGPTKKIIKEQEGKEDAFGLHCFLCGSDSVNMCMHTWFETQR